MSVQTEWFQWRTRTGWLNDPVHYAAKVAEEAGEVLGATLKMDQNGRAATHPGHDLEHLRQEIGQLTGTVMVLAEHYGINPMAEAEAELLRVMVRFPAKVQEAES